MLQCSKKEGHHAKKSKDRGRQNSCSGVILCFPAVRMGAAGGREFVCHATNPGGPGDASEHRCGKVRAGTAVRSRILPSCDVDGGSWGRNVELHRRTEAASQFGEAGV